MCRPLKLSREQEVEHIPCPASPASAALLPQGTVGVERHIWPDVTTTQVG